MNEFVAHTGLPDHLESSFNPHTFVPPFYMLIAVTRSERPDWRTQAPDNGVATAKLVNLNVTDHYPTFPIDEPRTSFYNDHG